MHLSPVGLTIDDLDTPALLVDLDALERNARRMAACILGGGKRWRPHAKAFKTPALAHLLSGLGADGLTVAKVSEAEVMVDGGIRDILIAHLVVGPAKAARLAHLQRRGDVKATVDHTDQLGPLSEAAGAAGVSIGLLVDLDIGLGRTGVPTIEAAVALAERVAETPGLRFEGLMGYEGHTLTIPDPESKRSAIVEAIDRLDSARSAIEAAGLACHIVSAGGSGSYPITSLLPGVTELQAGGGIFGCRYYEEACHIEGHEPAIGVLATVVSRPTADRAILDAGRKAIGAHLAMPRLAGSPDVAVAGLSAEHATLRLPPAAADPLPIGRKVVVTPGYSDLTFVLHDRVLACRNGRVEAAWELQGRGKLQ